MREVRAAGEDFDPSELDGVEVVDYTGAPARVPNHDGVRQPSPERPKPVEIAEGRVERPSIYSKQDLSRIPNLLRRDFVAGQRAAAALQTRPSDEVREWDGNVAALEAQADNGMVDFHAPAPRLGSGYGRDPLGRSIRLDRGGLQ